MIVAVIGSRSIKQVDIGKILPEGTTELISGGANGVDSLKQSKLFVEHYTSFFQS